MPVDHASDLALGIRRLGERARSHLLDEAPVNVRVLQPGSGQFTMTAGDVVVDGLGVLGDDVFDDAPGDRFGYPAAGGDAGSQFIEFYVRGVHCHESSMADAVKTSRFLTELGQNFTYS
ncbi:MAG: hypothetical protein U5Q16_07805 [Gammaproteobacteria bacterium]|nr:hypothetical protein [Gammaproteobacteria bacterium]